MSLPLLELALQNVSYLNWKFVAGPMGHGNYLQVRFTEEGKEWGGRKWYVSPHATRSEIVQTALKAVLTCVEHEAREKFTYKGQNIFGPHKDVDALLNLKHETRAEAVPT